MTLKTPEDFALEAVVFSRGSMTGPEALASAWKLVSTALVKPGIVLEAVEFLIDAERESKFTDTAEYVKKQRGFWSEAELDFEAERFRKANMQLSEVMDRYDLRSDQSKGSSEGRVRQGRSYERRSSEDEL